MDAMDTTAPIQDTSQGSWFGYYRDEQEQYIGVVTKNGEVFIFNTAKANVPVTVKGGFSEPIGFNNIPPDIAPQGGVDLSTNPEPYLVHTDAGDLQFITIEDYTYVTNRQRYPRMTVRKLILLITVSMMLM